MNALNAAVPLDALTVNILLPTPASVSLTSNVTLAYNPELSVGSIVTADRLMEDVSEEYVPADILSRVAEEE